jgi:pyruvate formate lyase activating enzyme
MLDVPPTPPATLTRARALARRNGLRYVYTGNVHDTAGSSTYCPGCGRMVVERDWYRLGAYRLTADGRCERCGTQVPGRYDGAPGTWGPRRAPVWLDSHAPVTFRPRRPVP